jgi:hypothetical protein
MPASYKMYGLRRASRGEFVKLVIKIALGVVLAAAIIGLAEIATATFVVYEASQAVERLARDARVRAEERQKQVAEAEAKAEAARQRLALQQQEAKRLAALKVEQEYLMSATFESKYTAPKGCQVAANNERWVWCVNERLKAKREFEQRWARGEVKPVALPKSKTMRVVNGVREAY